MADSVEPMDLGSWLESLGAPDTIMGVLPKELRDIDITSVLKMLAAVNPPTLGSIGVETASNSESGQVPSGASESAIHWLPIVRD
jgi:hypothetical protein